MPATERLVAILKASDISQTVNWVSCEWGVEERDWGARELVLRDPDGYYLTFTQRPTLS